MAKRILSWLFWKWRIWLGITAITIGLTLFFRCHRPLWLDIFYLFIAGLGATLLWFECMIIID